MRAWVASVVFLAGCATPGFQAGEPLPGVSMLARGSDVTLAWTSSSPVVPLLRPGASVEIVAEYASARGRVTGETLAIARVAADNSVRFSLPGSLRNAPTGTVCLRVKLPNQRGLPLRAAAPGKSTDDFRYPEWEGNVVATSRSNSFQASLSEMDRTVQRERELQRAFEQYRQERKVANVASCEQLVSPKQDRPPRVLEVSEYERASRRECVWRYRALLGDNADKVSSAIESIFVRRLSADRASADSATVAHYKDRVHQAQRLRAALASHDADTKPPFRPLLLEQPLNLISAADEELELKKGLTEPVAGAVLASFQHCLSEAVKQFQLARESWTAEQTPGRQNSLNEALRSECRARFKADAASALRVSDAQARQSQLSAELARLPPTPKGKLPAERSLIGLSCAASGS